MMKCLRIFHARPGEPTSDKLLTGWWGWALHGLGD